MKVERKVSGDVDILVFEGEWDIFNRPTTTRRLDALIDAGGPRIVLNFESLTFISSEVLAFQIKTAKRLAKTGGEIVIAEPSDAYRKTLRILGIEDRFKVFPDERAAVAYFHDDAIE